MATDLEAQVALGTVEYEGGVGHDVLLPAEVEVVLAVDGADPDDPGQHPGHPAPGWRQLVAVAALRAVEVDEPDGPADALAYAAAEVVVVHGDDLGVVVVQAEVVVVVAPGLVAATRAAAAAAAAATGTVFLLFPKSGKLRTFLPPSWTNLELLYTYKPVNLSYLFLLSSSLRVS